MSCAYGTLGAQCDVVYTLPGVPSDRAIDMYNLGKKLGLTEFNPTTVNWDAPVTWKSELMSTGAGYAMMLGFGFALTAITLGLSALERMMGNVSTSEHFNTAGREIKTGLTASVIVSQWTWAATLLQSSNVAWQYGITGPFWYASGASIQVLIFGILAIEIKRRAPNAHTFLEMVGVRWGKPAHFTFLFFGLATNLILSSMLLLGGCAVMNAVADIPIAAGSFIFPMLTLMYTFFGGLKATFLASYVHTTVIFIGLMLFVTVVYGVEFECNFDATCAAYDPLNGNTCAATTQCNSLGSASLMWERLRFVTSLPVRVGSAIITTSDGTNSTVGGFHQGPAFGDVRDGNRQGQYLTMMSQPGLMFGIINIIGNFGTVFVDQSYWQSAIAASPASAHKGYLLGGLVWFTIPFALATSLGLAGNALNVALTADDAGAGLVPPASAIVMMGGFGGFLAILMLFMAIISTGSAECIAVSSLWSYDVYRTYINPKASGAQILCQSRIVIVVWAFVMAFASIILNQMGLGLGWVYNFMGICVGSAVVPISCVVLTDKLNAMFAIIAAWTGFICAVLVWIIVAYSLPDCDDCDFVAKTGQLYAQLYGNLTAICSSGLICIIGCLIAPSNFDWNIMVEGIKLVGGDGGENSKVLGQDWESRPEFLLAAKAWIFKYGWGLTIFLVVWWPLGVVPWGVFGKSSYQMWASIAMIWGWLAGLTIIFLPLWESKDAILSVLTCKCTKPAEAAAETASA